MPLVQGMRRDQLRAILSPTFAAHLAIQRHLGAMVCRTAPHPRTTCRIVACPVGAASKRAADSLPAAPVYNWRHRRPSLNLDTAKRLCFLAFGLGLGACGSSSNGASPVSPSSGGPTLTAVLPSQAIIGTDVWIQGANLLTAASTAPVVKVDRFLATVKTATNSELLVTVPGASLGAAPVSVEVDGRVSATVPFQALAATYFDGVYDVIMTGAAPAGTMTLTINNGQPIFAIVTSTDCISGGGLTIQNSKTASLPGLRLQNSQSGFEYLLAGQFTSQTNISSGTFSMAATYSSGKCVGPYQWSAQRRQG